MSRRWLIAVAVAFVVGTAVIVGANLLIYGRATAEYPWTSSLSDFWGLVYGSFASVVAFGVTFALGAPERLKRAGLLMAAGALGLFGAAVVWWIVMWGSTPFSQEGLWEYSIAALAFLAAGFLVAKARRGQRSRGRKGTDWSTPPPPHTKRRQ